MSPEVQYQVDIDSSVVYHVCFGLYEDLHADLCRLRCCRVLW